MPAKEKDETKDRGEGEQRSQEGAQLVRNLSRERPPAAGVPAKEKDETKDRGEGEQRSQEGAQL